MAAIIFFMTKVPKTPSAVHPFFSGKRASGILAHITSLPSPFGTGDLGPDTWDFLDFLASSGQSYWQFLPTGPTDPLFGNSPYMTRSAFAGSPLLISPALLLDDDLITSEELQEIPPFPEYRTDYPAVILAKKRLLQKAHSRFNPQQNTFLRFKQASPWLGDYTLFMACRERFAGQSWTHWPKDISTRSPKAMLRLCREEQKRIHFYEFEQYEFYRQWQLLRDHAHRQGIQLIGDIPFYVGMDSADVWANQEIFDLDPLTRQPCSVAGVPPDYFSKTGQKWGNPLYRWHSKVLPVKEKLQNWWTSRFLAAYQLVDVVRIDHFRGFESYWSIPAEDETAMNGQWLPGPGKSFFTQLQQSIGPTPIIAEDLGEITRAVTDLCDTFNFPGMKVLQFAFDHNPANPFLPQNFTTRNCVAYTGTHDNDTTVGWFLDPEQSDHDRQRIRSYVNQVQNCSHEIHEDFIYLAMSSIARLTIFPLQDVLGFGTDCRMNTPGTTSGNWAWRCGARFLSTEIAERLYQTTTLFNRSRTPGLPENAFPESQP